MNYKEAVRWFRVAADLGKVTAMTNLGLMYMQGLGVKRDLDEASHWLGKGAAAGDELAKQYMSQISMMRSLS